MGLRDKDEQLAISLIGKYVIIGDDVKGGKKDLVIGVTVLPDSPEYLPYVGLNFEDGRAIMMPVLITEGYEVWLQSRWD